MQSSQREEKTILCMQCKFNNECKYSTKAFNTPTLERIDLLKIRLHNPRNKNKVLIRDYKEELESLTKIYHKEYIQFKQKCLRGISN